MVEGESGIGDVLIDSVVCVRARGETHVGRFLQACLQAVADCRLPGDFHRYPYAMTQADPVIILGEVGVEDPWLSVGDRVAEPDPAAARWPGDVGTPGDAALERCGESFVADDAEGCMQLNVRDLYVWRRPYEAADFAPGHGPGPRGAQLCFFRAGVGGLPWAELS